MIIKIDSPKYFAEVSTDLEVKDEDFKHWARDHGEIKEAGGEHGVGRWYNFPFNRIKDARKFRTAVKRKFKDTARVRIFKARFRIYEEHEVVE